MKIFVVFVFSLLAAACATTPDSQHPAPAEDALHPQSQPQQVEAGKFVPDPHYTEAEEAAYKKKFRKSDDDILYYFVIDSDGSVANSVLIDWRRDRYTKEFAHQFKQVTEAMKFEKAVAGSPRFREGFFPLKVCELIQNPEHCPQK